MSDNNIDYTDIIPRELAHELKAALSNPGPDIGIVAKRLFAHHQLREPDNQPHEYPYFAIVECMHSVAADYFTTGYFTKSIISFFEDFLKNKLITPANKSPALTIMVDLISIFAQILDTRKFRPKIQMESIMTFLTDYSQLPAKMVYDYLKPCPLNVQQHLLSTYSYSEDCYKAFNPCPSAINQPKEQIEVYSLKITLLHAQVLPNQRTASYYDFFDSEFDGCLERFIKADSIRQAFIQAKNTLKNASFTDDIKANCQFVMRQLLLSTPDERQAGLKEYNDLIAAFSSTEQPARNIRALKAMAALGAIIAGLGVAAVLLSISIPYVPAGLLAGALLGSVGLFFKLQPSHTLKSMQTLEQEIATQSKEKASQDLLFDTQPSLSI